MVMKRFLFLSLLEVQPEKISVLADTVNRADDYDLASSEQALENAVRLARKT